MFVQYGLAGLFANGVLGATFLPIPTEITVSALLASGHNELNVFLVLLAGTMLGGFIGYWIGRSGNRLFSSLRGKPDKEQQDRDDNILRKYGWIAIVGSAWVPVVGDFIPMVAGTKKYDLKKFALALAVGKATKAVAVVYLGSFLVGRLFG